MGWNDRLPEDPFVPSESYYRDKADYEAWLDYLESQLNDKAGISSQNVDPASLASKHTTQETPVRQGLLARLMARLFGKKVFQDKQQSSTEENAGLPF